MRTLITGVAGFVGRHLALVLGHLAREELNGTDHLTHGTWEADETLRCHLKSQRPLDVTLFEQVRGCLLETSPERVVHLAAQASGFESIGRPAETYKVNAIGALNVLEAVRVEDPGALVLLVGSADVYGTGAPGQKIREDAPMRPQNAYALSKSAADNLGALYAENYGTKVIRTRTFSHTGPGQGPRFAIAGWADQLARIHAGQMAAEIKVGNLEGVRDYGDVRDVVRAYRLLLERGRPGEAYNVCTGKGHIMRHLLDILCTIAGFRPTIVQDPTRVRSRDSDFLVGDPAKLQKETGWTPEIPIEKTLEDLYHEARERVRRETGR
ncbi:MAG TPA: GDP-mannose 4,6-dehydratase [Candidatus Polarisedimenticolia bacterium]|nr:GDP-mannose 4,6-dehydratase [Candidatus Polarisedimenticolia bacterium]